MLTHLLLLLLPNASAATITVGVDKTYDYQSIQEAIEALKVKGSRKGVSRAAIKSYLKGTPAYR